MHELTIKLLATKWPDFSVLLVDCLFWNIKEGKTLFEEVVTLNNPSHYELQKKKSKEF